MNGRTASASERKEPESRSTRTSRGLLLGFQTFPTVSFRKNHPHAERPFETAISEPNRSNDSQ